MSKPGRPRALDDSKRREICALLSAGCGIKEAARYVGCAARTIRREALRNPEFCDQLRRALITAEVNPLQAIRQASQKSWRAAAWLLERTNPQRFAKQDVRTLKPEQVDRYLDLMIKIVKEETRDPDTLARIVRRLQELSQAVERESWAEREPAPRSRRPKSRGRAVALPPAIRHATPHKPASDLMFPGRVEPQRHDAHNEELIDSK